MSFIYVHLSDIHFGQENGGQVIVNNDVKDQLIKDARAFLWAHGAPANGIILSGDTAYAGTESEYKTAGAWLDRLTAAIGCERQDVQIVPGNHDIDRGKISIAGQKMVDEILDGGDEVLNKYLASDLDREILYEKFSAYRTFAEAYDSPLDNEGNVLNHRLIELAPDKWLKFHGVNTALLCSKNKMEEGRLMLGQRQRVIPNDDNIEIVVIAHHPLNWLQDSEDSFKYLKNRARVFITGHEHMPAHKVHEVDEGLHLLAIASGAAAPPKANDLYTYCYNILEFDWDETSGKLSVKVHPRRWDDDKKSFVLDEKNFKKDKCNFLLKCPNFGHKTKKSAVKSSHPPVDKHFDGSADVVAAAISVESMANDQDQLLLLKFFRDLSSAQRLAALVQLKVFSADFSENITHTVETRAIRAILANGRAEELKTVIDLILSTKINQQND